MSVKFSRRSLGKLKDVHPHLVVLATAVLLKFPDYDISVLEGVRTFERQIMLKDTGKSKTLNSKHLKQDDGYSHAIDIKPSTYDWNDSEAKWKAFAKDVIKVANEMGLNVKSGGLEWSWDWVHFELVSEIKEWKMK